MPSLAKDAYAQALKTYGGGAMSFSGLKSKMSHWESPDEDAAIAYDEGPQALVAAGLPLAKDQEAAALAFQKEAQKKEKSLVFFGAEKRLRGWKTLQIGLQPVYAPGDWEKIWKEERRIREQVRRGQRKCEILGPLSSSELALHRQEIQGLSETWLKKKPMAPLHFVVDVEPFYHEEAHLYFIAKSQGKLVAFLSAVPIYQGKGWLLEDMFRLDGAPNGTSEALIDAFLKSVPEDKVSLGLAPLLGDIPLPMRLLKKLLRPLYHFQGLAAFKKRMHAKSWEPVFLLYKGSATKAILQSLRAFSGESFLSFAKKTSLQHPSGPPLALALPLIPWIGLLCLMLSFKMAPLMGYSWAGLSLWILFDLVLLFCLFQAALRPTMARLGLALGLASLDAALSTQHIMGMGFGPSLLSQFMRAVLWAAPLLGCLALIWALVQAHKRSMRLNE